VDWQQKQMMIYDQRFPHIVAMVWRAFGPEEVNLCLLAFAARSAVIAASNCRTIHAKFKTI